MEHFWIIPVIAIAVWILSNLIRPEEKPKRELFPPRRFPLPGMDQPPRPTSEVDRFLEEINRLRKKSEEARQSEEMEEPQAAPPPPPPRPVERPRPVPPVIEVVLPASIPTIRMAPAPVEVLDVLPAMPLPPPPPIIPVPIRRGSPAVAQLQAMLQSPQSLRTAMLLQTVLEPPRCRKRRS